ncbi:MAG TPA: amylo-alpha-1,6-glucosidase [Bauldia sp.]|nr:amylo-alpha-1,6-glucosidase [Bauldia sp.]
MTEAAKADFAPSALDGEEQRQSQRLYALKEGDSFVVADPFGDIVGPTEGFFRDDTRVVSSFRLALAGRPPSLLSTTLSQDSVLFTAHLTNRPLPPVGDRATPKSVVHIERNRFLWSGTMYERIAFTNYGEYEVTLPVALSFGADFRDMFEVRGERRRDRGRTLPTRIDDHGVVAGYVGLDGTERSMAIGFSPSPDRLTPDRAEFAIRLARRSSAAVFIEVGEQAAPAPSGHSYRAALIKARLAMRRRRRRAARVATSGRVFNEWIARSRADLSILTTDLPTGPYPYAGVPWFSTAFGRDAIITALQTLWLDPGLARGVLAFLAASQAKDASDFHDAAPGKIMHETRKGEMSARGELPFGRYYGSVDATPLFVVLAGAYADRTGDLAFIDTLWPALEAAMAWMEDAGDSDRDGLVDYARQQASGLANQGWKDSYDAVFHADGRFPRAPVALVEVQGYVFAARRAMSALARRRGEIDKANRWRRQAVTMRTAIERRFWMRERKFYGLAIDGAGALCAVRTSNAAHLLYLGVVTAERGREVAAQLLSAGFNSGWGIRTVAVGEARYNPMSYHNGSIWPHDTAIAAAGIARYGRRDGTVRLLGQMFEAAVQFDSRLPELFCGFERFAGEAPVAYPVACLPQAWAAGSVFMMLQACLGISVDGGRREIHVDRPQLPVGIDHVRIERLAVGDFAIALEFHRVGDRVVAVVPGDQKDAGRVEILMHL